LDPGLVGRSDWLAPAALAVGLVAIGLASLAWTVREARASHCPACGGRVEPGDRFCPWCGRHPVTKEGTPSDDPQASGPTPGS
jgi:hypothetical protein